MKTGTEKLFIVFVLIMSLVFLSLSLAGAASQNSTLSYDSNSIPIQGALQPYVAQSISVGAASAKNTTAFTCSVIRIYTTTDCYFNLGGSTVTATSSNFFLAAGTSEYITVNTNTYLAAIQSTASGTLYIWEMR